MNSFLPIFQREYAHRLGGRISGFSRIFELLQNLSAGRGPLFLVETGCVRDEHSWGGDGNSTVMFDHFARITGASFTTIDVSAAHCHLARHLCPATKVICGDSVASLSKLRQELPRIDFLYLDSFDLDWENPHPSALHHLKELCAAAPLLQPGALVFVDDNRGEVGKGLYIDQFMRDIGATLVHDDYQKGYALA